jgi:DNA-binding transcriptional LysR family regulator
VRTTRSVHLTPAGIEFTAHAKKILLAVNESRQSLHEYVLMEKGNISIGLIPIVGYYRLPNLLASFQKAFPGIKLSLQEEQCDKILDKLYHSEIDAAFVQHITSNPHFQFHPIITDNMVVVTSQNHPLASKETINLKDLINEKFIIPPQESGHYQDLFRACRLEGFEPNVLITCSHVRTILGLVREELGITVLSSYVAAHDVDPTLKVSPLEPIISRRIYLALKVSSDPSPTLNVFVKFALQWISTNMSENNYASNNNA